jgi:hypothetical protein
MCYYLNVHFQGQRVKYYLHKHYTRATGCGIDIRTLVTVCLTTLSVAQTISSWILFTFGVNSDLEMVWKGAGKAKVKLSVYAPWNHTGGMEMYVHSFLQPALDEDELSASRLGCCILGERTRYPLSRRVDGPCMWSGRFCEKNLALSGIGTSDRPARSHYTGYAYPGSGRKVSWRNSTYHVMYEYLEHSAGHLVDALRYKPEDRDFDSQWHFSDFSLT